MEEKILVAILFNEDKCDAKCSYLGEYRRFSSTYYCRLYDNELFSEDRIAIRCSACKEATGWRPKKELRQVECPPDIGQFLVIYVYKGEIYSETYERQVDGKLFTYEEDGTGDRVLTECEEGFGMVPDGVEDMVYLVAE